LTEKLKKWKVNNNIDRLPGRQNIAGGKLKESGFKHWNSLNTGATNEVAFSALP
jgi:hypothetical protein